MKIDFAWQTAIPPKGSTTNDLLQSENGPYDESKNGAGDDDIIPGFSSSEDPQNVNNDSSSTVADILPNNGEKESEFYESDNGSEDFVPDLFELAKKDKSRKKTEKDPAGETIKDGEEAASVEYEPDNGSSEEVVLPQVGKNLKKKASAWDFSFLKKSIIEGNHLQAFFSLGLMYSYKT